MPYSAKVAWQRACYFKPSGHHHSIKSALETLLIANSQKAEPVPGRTTMLGADTDPLMTPPSPLTPSTCPRVTIAQMRTQKAFHIHQFSRSPPAPSIGKRHVLPHSLSGHYANEVSRVDPTRGNVESSRPRLTASRSSIQSRQLTISPLVILLDLPISNAGRSCYSTSAPES